MRYIVFILLLFITACAPEVQRPSFEKPKFDFGPQKEDVDIIIKSKGIRPKYFNQSVFWDEVVNSSVVYRQAENMIQLSELLGSAHLMELSNKWINILETSPQFTQMIPLEQTPYIKVAAQTSQQTAIEEIDKALPELQKGKEKLRVILSQVRSRYKPEINPTSIEVVVDSLMEIIEDFKVSVGESDIYGPIKDEFLSAIHQYEKKLKSDREQKLPQILHSKSLTEFIKLLMNLIQSYEINIGEDTKSTLNNALDIGKSIDACRDETTALRALVDIWVSLTDKERKEIFLPINRGLYEYLDSQPKSGIECLRKENCPGVVRDFIKATLLYPKIRSYGVSKLCGELQTESVKAAKEQLVIQAQESILDIFEFIQEYGDTELSEVITLLDNMKKDFHQFLATEVSVWSKKNLPSSEGKVRALPAASLRVVLKDKAIATEVQSKPGVVSTEAIGSALAYSRKLLEKNYETPESNSRLAIEQIQRLLALGGYRDHKGNLAESLLRPIGNHQEKLDLLKLQSLRGSYASTDRVEVANGFDFNEDGARVRLDVSAKNQAELLRGISQMIQYFRDWVPSSYDSQIGNIQAKDVIGQLNMDQLSQRFFPKEEMLALAIGNAAVLLQNITKELSPIFLVDLNGQVIWANEFDFESESTAIMAGVVDIKNGQREDIVRSENVSRYLVALTEFLKATEGIELTKSKNLLSYDEYGKRTLDAVVAGRKEVKLLVVALANMLSYQMINKDGLIYNSLDLKNLRPVISQNISVLDQALAIRGLLAASEVTPVTLYRWSATDIYYSMNEHMYSSELRFYKSQRYNGIYFPILLETLHSLATLKPFLPTESQTRLHWLLEHWKYELFGLKL